MDFVPYEGGAPQRPQSRRLVFAALVMLAVAIAAVGVLARPHAEARPVAAAVKSVTSEPAVFGRPANADQDRGPGDVESDLAIVPEAHP